MNPGRTMAKCLAPMTWALGLHTRRWHEDWGIVVCYHRVVADAADNRGRLGVECGMPVARLEDQLRFLCERFRPVQASRIADERGPRFAVTFDDGHRDNRDLAGPVLRRLGIPATLFVCADYVGTRRRFWWERLAEVLREAPPMHLRFPPDAAPALPERIDLRRHRGRLFQELSQRLARVAHDRVEPALATLAEATDQALPERDGRPDPLLGWGDLQAMRDDGWEIGGHGAGHANHARLDTAGIVREITRSLAACRDGLQVPVDTYAYPYGMHGEAARTALFHAGVRSAFTTRRGVVSRTADRLVLPRLQFHRRWRFVWAYEVEDCRRRGNGTAA